MNKIKQTYHVHHILVKHAYEADDILRLLSTGKPFSDLALKYSICSSAKNQGDLGPIAEGKADPDFEQASLDLKQSEITKKPIRSRFGFHIIKRIS